MGVAAMVVAGEGGTGRCRRSRKKRRGGSSRGGSSKEGSKSRINTEPLFQGPVEPHPPTEDLNSEEDMNSFRCVRPRRRHHHRSSTDSAETPSMPDETKYMKDHYIFVGNVKKHMDPNYLKQTFGRYGQVVNVIIMNRESSSLPYA